jgi:hypothetical protein
MSLPDELHLEILKYLPPHPQIIIRASAVCREWRRILRDPGFLRLYRALHGEPSATALGFFHNAASGVRRRFVHISAVDDPASLSLPSSYRRRWKFVDCRHGRVLLSDGGWCPRFLLWHPMTGEHHVIPAIDHFLPSDAGSNRRNNAGLLCLCDDHGEGPEMVCHASPFRVAVVFCVLGYKTACVFSSLTGQWSTIDTWYPLPEEPSGLRPEPCAILGNTMYQQLHGTVVLACDTDQQILTEFLRPKGSHARLLRVDGNILGLAVVLGFTLQLWTGDDTNGTWVLRNKIDMIGVLPGLSTAPLPRTDSRFSLMPPVKIIAVVEDGDVLFLWTMLGIFMFSLKSKELKQVHEAAANMEIVYPYSASYLPLSWSHHFNGQQVTSQPAISANPWYLSDGGDRKRRRTTTTRTRYIDIHFSELF